MTKIKLPKLGIKAKLAALGGFIKANFVPIIFVLGSVGWIVFGGFFVFGAAFPCHNPSLILCCDIVTYWLAFAMVILECLLVLVGFLVGIALCCRNKPKVGDVEENEEL